jgi:hypothetical protein
MYAPESMTVKRSPSRRSADDVAILPSTPHGLFALAVSRAVQTNSGHTRM